MLNSLPLNIVYNIDIRKTIDYSKSAMLSRVSVTIHLPATWSPMCGFLQIFRTFLMNVYLVCLHLFTKVVKPCTIESTT